jgi:hypothetical protein
MTDWAGLWFVAAKKTSCLLPISIYGFYLLSLFRIGLQGFRTTLSETCFDLNGAISADDLFEEVRKSVLSLQN